MTASELASLVAGDALRWARPFLDPSLNACSAPGTPTCNTGAASGKGRRPRAPKSAGFHNSWPQAANCYKTSGRIFPCQPLKPLCSPTAWGTASKDGSRKGDSHAHFETTGNQMQKPGGGCSKSRSAMRNHWLTTRAGDVSVEQFLKFFHS